MKQKLYLTTFLLFLLPISGFALDRIVSLSPSITETLFALGAEKQVVAVTRFCAYPPETKEKIKVGGFLDLEIEKIISLRPDMVFLLDSDINNSKRLRQLGIPVTFVTQTSLVTIEKTITKLGKMTGHETTASRLQKEIAAKKKQIHKTGKELKLLLVVGRDAGSLKNIYVAGNKGFYNEIIQLAGCKNAFTSVMPLEYPAVSMEGILNMDPDMIIELVDDMRASSLKNMNLLDDWEKLPHLKAVKNRNIHLLVHDYVTVPGPRIFNLISDIRDLAGKKH